VKKITFTILLVTIIVVLLTLVSNSLASSANPCDSCHRGYYQYLDILEDDSANQIPTKLNVNETKTVSVSIENQVNTAQYSTLSGVTVTLNSLLGQFSIDSPTVSLGDLQPGKKTASWQITGISDGFDYISISVTAYNPHRSSFSDSYLPYPLIAVGNATGTPPPPPSVPSSSSSTPTANSASTPSSSQSSTSPSQSTGTPNPAKTTPPSPTDNVSILLKSPAGGERWLIETSHEIEWDANGGIYPLSITLEYRKADSEKWIIIAINVANNGSITWTTPNLAATYDFKAEANDSSIPPLTATVTKTFEAIQNQTNPDIPMLPITTVAISAVAVGAVLSIRKKKLAKQENGKKTNVSKLDNASLRERNSVVAK
jgi:hypothetical protein